MQVICFPPLVLMNNTGTCKADEGIEKHLTAPSVFLYPHAFPPSLPFIHPCFLFSAFFKSSCNDVITELAFSWP